MVKIKKSQIIKLLISCLVIFTIIIVFLLFTIKYSSAKPVSPSAQQNQSAAKNSVVPPIPVHGKNILFFGFIYSIGGVVENFAQNGDKYHLKLRVENPSIHEFDVTSKTTVVRIENGAPVTAQFADIKQGERVVVSVLYDTIKSIWVVTRVTILAQQPNPNINQ